MAPILVTGPESISSCGNFVSLRWKIYISLGWVYHSRSSWDARFAAMFRPFHRGRNGKDRGLALARSDMECSRPVNEIATLGRTCAGHLRGMVQGRAVFQVGATMIDGVGRTVSSNSVKHGTKFGHSKSLSGTSSLFRQAHVEQYICGMRSRRDRSHAFGKSVRGISLPDEMGEI